MNKMDRTPEAMSDNGVSGANGDTGTELEGGGSNVGCNCSRCGVYRWYPILLALSTVMAGVFCWMYISKPVFVSGPGGERQSSAESEFRDRAPVRVHDGVDADGPPTAGNARALDPSVSHLPGEVEGAGGMQASVAPLNSGGLEPIVVPRRGSALFQPFLAGEAAREAGERMGEAGGETGDSPMESEAIATGVDSRSDQRGYRVRPSFMAEFSHFGDSDSAKDDIAELDSSNLR